MAQVKWVNFFSLQGLFLVQILQSVDKEGIVVAQMAVLL